MTTTPPRRVSPHPALLLREADAAELLGLQPRTLADWRASGRGPRYVRISRRCVRYSRADLEAWVAGQTYASTAAESAVSAR